MPQATFLQQCPLPRDGTCDVVADILFPDFRMEPIGGEMQLRP